MQNFLNQSNLNQINMEQFPGYTKEHRRPDLERSADELYGEFVNQPLDAYDVVKEAWDNFVDDEIPEDRLASMTAAQATIELKKPVSEDDVAEILSWG